MGGPQYWTAQRLAAIAGAPQTRPAAGDEATQQTVGAQPDRLAAATEHEGRGRTRQGEADPETGIGWVDAWGGTQEEATFGRCIG